jgi:hypothetical protein
MATKSRSRSRPPSPSSSSCHRSDASCCVKGILHLVGGLPRWSLPMACGGLLAGPELPLGGCSRDHFERLSSNEALALILIESHLDGG